MKNKIETWLPVFPGFYNTIFEVSEDSEIDDINCQRDHNGLKPVDFNKVEFDYKEYEDRVAKACINFIENELNHIFKSKIGIEIQKISSPREYNFYNDSIWVIVNISNAFLGELEAYLIKHREAFDKYIIDHYTSHSGFMSSHSNDSEVWLKENFDKLDTNGHYLGSLLQFVCKNEDINQDDMLDEVCSEMYLSATNYHELVE